MWCPPPPRCSSSRRSSTSRDAPTIRLFWFLASFQSSWALFAAHDKGVDAWLGVLAQSASGMFGLMESLTLPDLAGAGVTLFGRVEAARLDHEAQVLWLVALYASALGSAAKLLAVLAHRPVPPTSNGFGAALDGRRGVAAADEGTKGEKREAKEHARKREVQRRRAEAGALGSKLLADLLDTAIPASKLGWLNVGSRFVGVAMLCSTVLTSMTVWDRCRRRLHATTAA